MKENMDRLEQAIREEFDRAAREEEVSILKDDSLSVPEGMEAALFAGISEKIEAMRQEDLYANMSEADKKALEIGRRVMEEEAREEARSKMRRKKKRFRMYIGLAAALVLAMAVGVNSLGGPERIIQIVTQMVGGREVEKINSSDDNLIIVGEDEEKAYQELKDEFGVDPVRIIVGPVGMRFKNAEIDKKFQLAELSYDYKGENVKYFINASFAGSSWGIDVEDEKVNQYEVEKDECKINIKEYQTPETLVKRYSANFKYLGLEYYLIATMDEDEFLLIIDNLHFLP
ncbi:DUF4367 domain-containing protein [Sporofaciens sp. JLR.KK001]|uniref:DUF4367 domain-containing protein n=1 Tax=Sporofaciens sp. JLR.KK001 TaxID=3112621 RepID=UPI002FF1F1FE